MHYGTGVCVLPAEALAVPGTDRTDLLVLMQLAADPTLSASPKLTEILAERIGCQACKISAALALWQSAGILTAEASQEGEAAAPLAETSPEPRSEAVTPPSGEAAKPSEAASSRPAAADSPSIPSDGPHFCDRPMYSGEELAQLTEAGAGKLRRLSEECQRICGKIFTPTEVGKVVALSEYLGLSSEHILMLFQFCAERGKSSVSYIEKTAYNLYDEGVRSAEQLEAYLRRKEEAGRREDYYRRLFGIGTRSLTAAEREAFRRWPEEWGMSDEMIEYAFTVMAEHTGSYKFTYLSKVLQRWHEEGYRTPEEVKAARFASKGGSNAAASGESSFDTDSFISLALRRSYEKAGDGSPSEHPAESL